MAYLGRPGATAPLTSADIPDNSITAAKIVDATIAAGDLAPNSVDSSELVDGSVDLSHMSADSVDSDQYVDGSIDTAHIGANQVTAAKVAADVATQAELDAQRTNSSITTLGTVTAGNLSNSAIVYPNGHVVQVLTGISGTYVQSGGGSSATWGNTAGLPSVTITPTDATNKIFLMLTLNCHSAAHTIYVDFYRSISGGATTHNLSGATGGLAYSSMDYTQQVAISFLDSPSTTSAITYKGSFRSAGGSQVVYFGDSATNSIITAMEVVA